MSKSTQQITKTCFGAMFLTIGWLLPFITGQIPEVGSMLLPMHIPALLCGFILGPWYGLGVGFLMPVTRSLVFGVPLMYPQAISMAFELAAYGFISGSLFNVLLKKIKPMANIYISLVSAMVIGRIVWGIARFFCGIFVQNSFTFKLFISGSFITAWPGILLQLLVIPSLIKILYSAKFLDKFIIKENSINGNNRIN